MSRRSHRHGDRGYARPPRLDQARPSSPGPAPAESGASPDRPTSVVLARAVVPSGAGADADAGGPATGDEAAFDSAATGRPLPAEAAIGAAAAVRSATAGPGDEPLPADEAMRAPTPSVGPAAGPGVAPGQGPSAEPGQAFAGNGSPDMGRAGCTSPQLRRFIKSRAYTPMHELRRRFAIEGPEDDVSAIELDGTRLYVGLPEREGRLLAELLRGGDIGAELSYDPVTPVIVGVYPMRPVPRT
jgi:hypothetical protein